MHILGLERFGKYGHIVSIVEYCATQKPDILFISEPIVSHLNLPQRFWRLCGLKLLTMNDRGGSMSNLHVYYKEDLEVSVIANSSQHITIEVTIGLRVTTLSSIYVSTSYVLIEDSGVSS